MHIEDLKFWHWVVLGLVVGALFSGVKLWQGPFDGSKFDSIEQRRFERGLVGVVEGPSVTRADTVSYLEKHPDTPVLKNIVVHPPAAGDDTYWVTGSALVVEELQKNPYRYNVDWVGFKYPAKVPYEPLTTLELQAKRGRAGTKALMDAKAKAATQPGAQTRSEYPNIAEYLQAVQTRSDAKFTYRYAWQERPLATAVLPPIAGLLVIGIAWPLALGVMQGAGLARKPQPRAKLTKRRETAAVKGPVDTSAGDKQLADLNATLEAEMAGFIGVTPTRDPDDSSAGAPAVKALPGGVGAASETKKPEDDEVEVKEFGGEFYPVVKSVHKEHRHHDDEPSTTPTPAKK
jgi:hypothetical protein